MTTWSELKKYVKEEQEFYDSLPKTEFPTIMFHSHEPYTLKDYCDRRRSTDLARFDYCPYCGEKINWKAFKEESKNESN